MTKRSKRSARQLTNLVSKVASLTVSAKTPPKRRRKQRARRVVGAGPPRCDPFLHCVLGPLSQNGTGEGAPDGSVYPSVVIEHRSTLVAKPNINTGNITFAVVPSSYGCIGLGEGNFTVPVNAFNYSADTPVFVSPQFNQTINNKAFEFGDNAANYELFPFLENARVSGNVLDATEQGLQPTHFRVLTTQAKVSYTGSTFTDNGTAATARQFYEFDEEIPNPLVDHLGASKTVGTLVPIGVRLPQAPPTTFAQIASMAGSRVFPVREGANLLSPPTNLEYQEIRDGWSPFTESGEGFNPADGVVNLWFCALARRTDLAIRSVNGVFGHGHGPVSYYAASGMDPSASLTIETRTCVEYRLAFSSPSARFARSPPIERPLAVKALHELARDLPSSTPVTPVTEETGWLGNALAWYGNTMRNVVGGAWKTAGAILRESRVPLSGLLGTSLARSGAALSGQQTAAIGYGM